MSNIWDAFKFIGERGSEYLKKGNPFGKISDIVSTEKLRDSWNRNKNIMAATGAVMGGGYLGLGKAGASAIEPVAEAAAPVTESVGTAAKGGVLGKDFWIKQGANQLMSGQPLQDDQYQQEMDYWNDYLKSKQMERATKAQSRRY